VLDQHPHKRPKKKTGKFPKKKCYKKDSDKSEGAGATMHQVYSVMARAGPEEWILDSGASAHMTGIKSLLKDYKEVAMTTVTVANGDILPAKGVGNISFKTEHGYVTFTGVLHVPGLDRNLISVPQLTSKGLAIRMLKDKCVISGKQGHVMTVKKSGSFYSINCYTAQVAVTEIPKSESPRFPDDVKYSTELCLWHQRFGHLASKSIVSMSIKRLVEGLPKLDQSLESIAPLCTGCLLGKFDRRPFRPTSKKAGSVCEKVHMDIKGPMDMMSIGKHLYFLILVDDYSGLTVAYPMQKKSDALKFYRGFAEQAWNQTGKRIRYLRCDNAKEFLSSAFNEYLSTQGTVLQDIPDYTPELNGTAERNIRTVMNMMRSMLKGAGLPKNLWAEAIIAACYIKNRFTSSGKSTPHELWFGTKPDVSGLRIYGCTAFVHVPKEKRKALDDRSEECILIGYGSGNTYWDSIISGTRSNHYTSMMMKRKRTRKLLLKMSRNLLAKNLHSR